MAGIGNRDNCSVMHRFRCIRGIVLHRTDCVDRKHARHRSGGLRYWSVSSIYAAYTFIAFDEYPLPYTLQAILTVKLQILSTNLGVALIRLIGLPVYVEGNIVDLGTYKIQVAEACSGLRYLLPLTCISFIVAYVYKAPFWKKAVVVVSAVPITILINSFKIAVTAVLVGYVGTQIAEGFLHQFEGWIVFLIGVLLLGFEIVALERFRWSNVEIGSITERPATSQHVVEPRKIALPLILTVLVCAGTLGVTASIASAYKSVPNPVRENFAEFPRRIDRWTAQRGPLEPGIRRYTQSHGLLYRRFCRSIR